MANTWYVGCTVRLKLRLEDGTFTPPPLPRPIDAPGPEGFGSGSIDDLVAASQQFIVLGEDIVPLSCTIELNSYRTADTARVTIPFARFPFDPRMVRAATLQVFAGVFTPAEWARALGTSGEEALLISETPSPGTAVPDAFGTFTNELFRGFVDEHSIDINESEQVVEFAARDLTAEMIDAEIPPGMLEDLPGFLRLDVALQLLLTGDGLPQTAADNPTLAGQLKTIGEQRKQLLAEAREELAIADDADAVDEPEVAAAARAKAAQLQAQARALSSEAAALPQTLSRRFGLPGFRGIVVVNEVLDPTDPAGERVLELPTFDQIRPKAWVDSRGTVKKGRKKSPGNKQKIAYWDFITDVVNGAGYIVYVRTPRGPRFIGGQPFLPSAEIVITNPRTYYRDGIGAVDSYTPLSTRAMVFGLNCTGISIKRNLKGQAVPSVRVQSFDTRTGTLYSATYPPLPKNNRASVTGDGDRTEVKVFNLDQISGNSAAEIEANLYRAAASMYEQLSRGDFEVEVKTRSLAGLLENLGDGWLADLFAMRPKDPCVVEIPATQVDDGVVNNTMLLANASLADMAREAYRVGLAPENAIEAAKLAQSPILQNEFRTQKISWDWSTSRGWEAKLQLINYLDVRDSIQVTDARAGQAPV